jgi:hypothetical protein
VLVSETRLNSKRLCLDGLLINNIQFTNDKQLKHDIHPSMNNMSIIEARDDNQSDYAFSSSEHHNIETNTRDNIENEPHIIDTSTQYQSSTTFCNQITQDVEYNHDEQTVDNNTNEINSTISFGSKKPSSSTTYFVLKNKGINLYIRDNYGYKEDSRTMKDYSSQIAIYLKNNFNHKRTPQPTLNSPQQRITRSLSTSISRSGGRTLSSVVENENSNHGCNSKNDNGNILSAYFRCYVEDYMILPHDEELLLCIPDEVKTFERYESDAKTKFGSKVYRIYYSKIISAPHYHLCRNGMKYIDVNHAFNDGKYGSYVSLIQPRLIHCSESNNLINNGNDSCILLTWKEVLHGRMAGIQVWRKRENGYRDVYSTFKARKKKLIGLKNILNYLYPEVFGDQIQLFHLLNCYYKSNSEYQSTLVKANETKLNKIPLPIKLQGDTFQSLLHRIDNVFETAVKRTYNSFIVYGMPLLTNEEVNIITNDYMSNFSGHYNQMKQMLQFNKKESRIRNFHLSSTNYYNRQLLYTFLSQARIVNCHNLVHFGLVLLK